MLTFGFIAALAIAGSVFFAGGVEPLKKAPYPYRWVDITFQLTVGSAALLAGAVFVLDVILSIFRHAQP